MLNIVFRRHLRMGKKISCEKCNYKCTEENNLKVHVSTTHEPQLVPQVQVQDINK